MKLTELKNQFVKRCRRRRKSYKATKSLRTPLLKNLYKKVYLTVKCFGNLHIQKINSFQEICVTCRDRTEINSMIYNFFVLLIKMQYATYMQHNYSYNMEDILSLLTRLTGLILIVLVRIRMLIKNINS